MGQQDDIDKLLREIDAMNTGAVQPRADSAPVPRPGSEAATVKPAGSTGGRLAWTGVSAVGAGLAGGVVGTILTMLPTMGTLSTAVGAALGGALVGFVSGPPRWFDQE